MTTICHEPIALALPWPEQLLDAMGYHGQYAQLMLWWEPGHVLRVFDGDLPIKTLDAVPWQLLESCQRFRRVLCNYAYTSPSVNSFPREALLLDATRKQILAGTSDELRQYLRNNRRIYNALSPGDEQYQAIEFEFAIRIERKDKAYRQLREWLSKIA